MPVARILSRDRLRASWIILLLLLVASSGGGILAFSNLGYQESIDALTQYYKPHLRVDIAYGMGQANTPTPSYASGLEALANELETSKPRLEHLEYHGSYLVLDLAIAYKYVVQGSEGEPMGLIGREWWNQGQIASIPYHGPNGVLRHCNVFGSHLLAAVFKNPRSASEAGFQVIEGSYPGGDGPGVEAAVSKAIAVALGVGPGDTLELFPGLELMVTGVFSGTSNGASYYDLEGMVHFIIAEDDLGELANASLKSLAEAVKTGGPSGLLTLYNAVGPGVLPDDVVNAILARGSCRDNGVEYIPGSAALALEPLEEGVEVLGGAIRDAYGVEVPVDVLRDSIAGKLPLNGNLLTAIANLDKEFYTSLPRNTSKANAIITGVMDAFRDWLSSMGVSVNGGKWTVPAGGPPPPPPGEGQVVLPLTGYYVVSESEEGLWGIYESSISQWNNPMAVLSLVLVTIATFLLGLRASSEVLSVVSSDLRRYISLLAARGAPPRSMARSFLAFIVAVSLVAGFAGSVATVYLVDRIGIAGTSLARSVALGLVITLLVGLFSYRRASRLVRDVAPIEAVRPVATVSVGERVRHRVSAFIVALGVTSIVVGLYGDIETLAEKASDMGGAIGSLAVIAIVIAYMFSPFAPAALADVASNLLGSYEAIFSRASRWASLAAGHLAWAASSSAGRLRRRLVSGLTAPTLAFGLALGLAFSLPVLGSVGLIDYYESLLEGKALFYTPGLIAGYRAAESILAVVALYALVVGGLSLYVLLHSALRIVVAEMVVARARGAGRGEALRLAYSMLLPISLHSLIAGLLVGGVVYLAVVSSARLASLGGFSVPLTPSQPMVPLVFLLALLLLVLGLPLVLSYRSVSSGDLASRLRRLGM
ncbi:MAG: hypothetical protein F7C38_02645 [Desulfurococcales archaeon]|nr:hypothetical protein [Desulfurococcales archaeon]